MRRKKRCAFLLSVVFILTALLSFPYPAKAETSSAGSSVVNRLDRVLKEYPKGTKWTGGGECYGFARFVVDSVFGKAGGKERGWYAWVKEQKDSNLTGMEIIGNVLNKGYGRNELYDLLQLAKPGDVIQCTGDGDVKGHYLHSMIVYSVKINKKEPESSEIVIYDNNWGHDNIIRLWGAKSFKDYYADVKNRGKLVLLRADNYDTIDTKTFLFIDKHATIAAGNAKTLKVVISPAQAYQTYQKGLQWSSSDPAIATVSQNGKITGIKAGSVKITVKTSDGSYSAACKVNIVDLEKSSALDAYEKNDAIKISWKKVPKEIKATSKDIYSFASYTLKRREVGGDWTDLKDQDDFEKTSYTDKKPEAGKVYEYRIRAKYKHTYNAGKGTYEESVWGPWQVSSQAGIAPSPPETISLVGEENGITVLWSASKNTAKYAVLRKEGTGDWKLLTYTTDESYLDKTAKAGRAYQYAVRSYGGIGWGTASLSTSITYTAAPKLSSVSGESGNVQVVWEEIAGAAMYRVFRKEGSGAWKKIVDTSKLSYTDKTAKSGKTYFYTVRCITKDGKNYTSPYDTLGKKITVK